MGEFRDLINKRNIKDDISQKEIPQANTNTSNNSTGGQFRALLKNHTNSQTSVQTQQPINQTPQLPSNANFTSNPINKYTQRFEYSKPTFDTSYNPTFDSNYKLPSQNYDADRIAKASEIISNAPRDLGAIASNTVKGAVGKGALGLGDWLMETGDRVMSPVYNAADKLGGWLSGKTDEQVQQIISNRENAQQNAEDNIGKLQNKLDESIYNTAMNTSNPVARKVAEIAPSAGQSLASAVIGLANPALGLSTFGASAAGNYYRDKLNQGWDADKAYTYGNIMGTAEALTEAIPLGTYIDAIKSTGIAQSIGKFGLSTVYNALQEAIMEPIDTATSQIISNDYNKQEWKDIGSRMLESGIDGALLSLLMGGAGAGLKGSISVIDNVMNGKTVSSAEIQTAIDEIKINEAKVDEVMNNELEKNQGKQIVSLDTDNMEFSEQNENQQNGSFNLQENNNLYAKANNGESISVNPSQTNEQQEQIPNGFRKRNLNETAKNSNVLNDQTRDLINTDIYKQKSNEQSLNEARAYLDNIAGETLKEKLLIAENDIFNGNAEKNGILSGMLAKQIVDEYEKMGDYGNAAKLIERLSSEKSTKLGQEIQALSIFQRSLPETQAVAIENFVKEYNNNNSKKIEWSEEKTNNLIKELKDVNTATEEQAQKLKDDIIKFYNNQKTKDIVGKTFLDKQFQKDFVMQQQTLEELQELRKETIFQEVYNQIESNVGNKIATYQTISHLLNPKTYARNIISNEIFNAIEQVNRNFAGWLNNNLIYRDSTSFKGLSKAEKKMIDKMAKEDARKVRTKILLGTQNQTQSNKFDSQNAKRNSNTFKKGTLGSAEKILNLELLAPDEQMKSKVKNTYLQQAKNQGFEITDDLIKQAEEYAKYVTFQDNNWLSDVMVGMKAGLNSITSNKYLPNAISKNMEGFGLGDLTIKYPRVPANITMRTLEYSPIGLIKSLGNIAYVNYQYKRGKISVQQRNNATMNLTRGITGTSLISLGVVLTAYGILAGDDDEKNENIQKLLRDSGLSGNKLNLSAILRAISNKDVETLDGDLLASYKIGDPITNLVALGQTIYQNKEKFAGDEGAKGVLAGIGNVSAEIIDLPSNQAINTIINTYKYAEYSTDNEAERWLTALYAPLSDALSGFVPSMLREMSYTIDPVNRQVYEETNISGLTKQGLNKTVRNIPFASMLLNPTIRSDGTQKTSNDGNILINAISQFSPVSISKVDKIEGIDKLDELSHNEDGSLKTGTGSAAYLPVRNVSTIGTGEDKKRLTNKEKSEYMEAYGEKYSKEYMTLLGKYSTNQIEKMNDKQRDKLRTDLAKINKEAKKYAESKVLKNK